MPSHAHTATRRRMYRRRRITVFSLAALVVLALAYVAGAAAAPFPAAAAEVPAQSTLTRKAAVLDWPAQGAAAVSALGYPGTLAAKGSTASVPIASMTKTITALVVLSKKPLRSAKDPGPTITFTAADKRIQNDVVANGGSWATVTPGATMSERQALEAMLLPSANNYAISLADWAFGSVPAYVKVANRWLAAHKLRGTHVADPTGFSPKSRSTPADLVAIAKLVMSDPALPSIVSTKSATLPGSGLQTNRNKLLGVQGINGIKTGNTSQAGYCLMFSATMRMRSHSVTIVGAVVGQRDDDQLFRSVSKLVASAEAGFHEVVLTAPGKSFGDYATAWGESSALVARSRRSMVVWSDTPITVRITTARVRSADAGRRVATATFTLGGHSVKAPLTLASAIAPPSLWWKLTHPAALR